MKSQVRRFVFLFGDIILASYESMWQRYFFNYSCTNREPVLSKWYKKGKRLWNRVKKKNRNRTHDLPNTRCLLFPLSYKTSWRARSFNWGGCKGLDLRGEASQFRTLKSTPSPLWSVLHNATSYLLENCHGCIRRQDVISLINKHLLVVGIWITTTEIFLIEFKCLMEKCCGVLENWA